MKPTEKHTINRYRDGSFEQVEDTLAAESLLKVKVNNTEVLSLYCTPLMIRELVVGFLMTEGVAEGVCTERMSIMFDKGEVQVEVHAEGEVKLEGAAVTSGCVGGVTFHSKDIQSALEDDLSIKASELVSLFKGFQKKSALHQETGCVHSAAIADLEGVLAFAEDIGRHNAVDKAIGYMILEGMDFDGKLMMASGRLSSEIVSKCARWGIPLIASRTAPTALAIEMAQKAGITTVGFLRGERFNVYTHPRRITP